MVEVAGIVGEISFEDVERSVAIVVCDANTHPGLFVTVVAVSDSGQDGDIGKRAVVIVAEQDAWLRVDGDVDVGQPSLSKS